MNLPCSGCLWLIGTGVVTHVRGGACTRFERSSGGGLMFALTTTVFLPLSRGNLHDAKA